MKENILNFDKVLIANRGEVALRIIRTLKEMDIKSVAVYSEADRFCAHVQAADEALCIGPQNPKESYLNIEAIITAAKISKAQAIHPGYGFLAENVAFAKAVEDAGLVFIGPNSQTILELGQKAHAKLLAKKSGVPLIPGSKGIVAKKDSLKEAQKIGFPIMIKAALGGGGKGMRVAWTKRDFSYAYDTASAEALNAFGNGQVYFEKLILNPRHIEVQVAADNYGNAIAFAERDCSMQRHHQKLIEESPSPFVNATLRKKLQSAALNLIKEAGYKGLGTVEFLLDEEHNFYFMEVNTRLQVEHPITERVCGSLDLVKIQIEIAQGKKLAITKEQAQNITCHAIEHRINAEDYQNNWLPDPGDIKDISWPGGIGVRVDSHIYTNYSVPPFYDSLIAKLIISAPTREEALKRSMRALEEFKVKGIKTTIDLHKLLLQNEDFIKGNAKTGLIEKILNEHEK
jgi:acetyl-CoA carboxylase biotin carboxylase subunit